MARIIDLQFNDKTYSIEYNREAVLKIFSLKNDENDEMENAINLIYCGLLKHHRNEMPDREVIIEWLLALGEDTHAFISELQQCIQEVLEVVQKDQKSKNLKWGVRK
jgi:hypothetical protein